MRGLRAGAVGGAGAGGARAAVAHVVLRVRRVRRRAAGRVHGARGRALLRARLPAAVRRALRVLPAVHLGEGAAGETDIYWKPENCVCTRKFQIYSIHYSFPLL